jgi:glucose-1-phosphate cytidylyltransferase
MPVPRKAVILAGGYGTRLTEETGVKPKPMVEIGGGPILWHIMKIFAAYGVNEFVICAGYKGHLINEYFINYRQRRGDVTYDLETGGFERHSPLKEPWKVTVAQTGWDTMTGGRLLRVRQYLNDEPFFMTYGDGVADVDLRALAEFHRSHGRLATVTAVQPPGRFGAFTLHPGEVGVTHFREKPQGDGDSSWINGGFFLLEPSVFDYIEGRDVVWEREPMEQLAREGELAAYRHEGFWQPMDTVRDMTLLEQLWASGKAPWKVW